MLLYVSCSRTRHGNISHKSAIDSASGILLWTTVLEGCSFYLGACMWFNCHAASSSHVEYILGMAAGTAAHPGGIIQVAAAHPPNNRTIFNNIRAEYCPTAAVQYRSKRAWSVLPLSTNYTPGILTQPHSGGKPCTEYKSMYQVQTDM